MFYSNFMDNGIISLYSELSTYSHKFHQQVEYPKLFYEQCAYVFLEEWTQMGFADVEGGPTCSKIQPEEAS